ncbi:MAG: hypothetical protein ACOYOS_03980 [Syntrophales bacterium]
MLVSGVLEGDTKGGLNEFNHTGGNKYCVKYRYQKHIFCFPHDVPGRHFSDLAPVDFRKVGENNKEHDRIFDAVNIGPEDTENRQQPNLIPLVFKYIKENDDKQIGKEMRTHQQFPI